MSMKQIKIYFLLSVLLFIAVISPLHAIAASQPANNYEKAVDLKILGLFAGTPDGFELDRAPTRLEGAVMLLRLLGKENQLNEGAFTHPFTDVPDWADKYIGYMFQNKLTNGVSKTKFGSAEPLSARQYAVFVLRSLGYSDTADFSYSQAAEKARKLGLLSDMEASALKNNATFLRNNLVAMSYNALSVKMKDSDTTLLDKLVNTDKFVFKPAATALGLYTSDLKSEYTGVMSASYPLTGYGYAAKNSEDLFRILRKALYANESSVQIDVDNYGGSVTDDFKPAFARAADAVEYITGVVSFVRSWEYTYNSHSLKVTFEYRLTKAEFKRRMENKAAALNKARHIVVGLITTKMSDYDKEKILHDYIINNTRYDYKNYLKGAIPNESFEAYGCLVGGDAVCEGYSKAMKLLCDLSGLECMVVTGESGNNGSWVGHAWNIVRIDGLYYHLDVTNDDPVSPDGSQILTYFYFNLSDSEISKTNKWNRAGYPACTNTKSGYYYKNNLIADNKEAFEKAVTSALYQRQSAIELKALDYTKAGYSDLYDIIFKSDSVSKYSVSVNEEFGIIRIFNIKYS